MQNSTTTPPKGFTLIELMVVVAIIGILAAIAIPQFSTYRIKAFNAMAMTDLRAVMSYEEAYYATEQSYIPLSTGGAPGPMMIAVGGMEGFRVSKGVVIEIATTTLSGSDTYAGSSYHANGNTSYSVTGSVGIIRKQ